MLRADAMAILSILKASYQQFYKGLSKEEAEDIINLWCMMFETEAIHIVKEAVKALIYTNKFPPTIADVKEKIELLTKQQTMTELEAWSIVSKAIKDSNYNSQQHFDNFPDEIKKIIRTPSQLRDWAMMDSDTVNSVVSSNFMRSYKANMQYRQQINKLPQSGKNLLEMVQDKLLLEDNNG